MSVKTQQQSWQGEGLDLEPWQATWKAVLGRRVWRHQGLVTHQLGTAGMYARLSVPIHLT